VEATTRPESPPAIVGGSSLKTLRRGGEGAAKEDTEIANVANQTFPGGELRANRDEGSRGRKAGSKRRKRETNKNE